MQPRLPRTPIHRLEWPPRHQLYSAEPGRSQTLVSNATLVVRALNQKRDRGTKALRSRIWWVVAFATSAALFRRVTGRYAHASLSPDDIKALRTTLQCTTRELADAIGVEQKTIIDWEGGNSFPTKKHVDRMAALREKGPSAVPRKARGASPPPLRVLADPQLWEVVRKLLAHKKLRDEVLKLAANYADPAED